MPRECICHPQSRRHFSRTGRELSLIHILPWKGRPGGDRYHHCCRIKEFRAPTVDVFPQPGYSKVVIKQLAVYSVILKRRHIPLWWRFSFGPVFIQPVPFKCR